MTIDKNMKAVRASTVKSYSVKGSMVYDDPMNKNFLYGEITMKFLDHLEFSPKGKVVLDLGCGTGFIFEYLFSKFHTLDLLGIGIEPAMGMLNMAIEKISKLHKFLSPIFRFQPLVFNRVSTSTSLIKRIFGLMFSTSITSGNPILPGRLIMSNK